MPNGSSSVRSVCSCCSVRISVGAMKALWQSFSCANQMHAAATSVLPEPTSPCTRRLIGTPEIMSCTAAATARRCAPVGEKGSVR